jgi:ParB family transcriptional regulator, chromosome partitioning protein
MTDTISIPLNKLLVWEGNVRKTDTDKAIDELAASIYVLRSEASKCGG